MSDLEKMWDAYQEHQRVKGGRCSCGASSYPCRWRAGVRDAMLKLGVDPLVDARKPPTVPEASDVADVQTGPS